MSSAWPSVLLILCAPVWFRSSRLSQICAPPHCSRQPLGKIQRRRAADVVLQQVVQLGLKRRVLPGLVILRRQLIEGPRQRLRHIPAAKGAKPAGGIGEWLLHDGHRISIVSGCAGLVKAVRMSFLQLQLQAVAAGSCRRTVQGDDLSLPWRKPMILVVPLDC